MNEPDCGRCGDTGNAEERYCACSDFESCDTHAAMLEDIAALYWKGDMKDPENVRKLEAVCAHADGYGEVGFVPDWSAIRDSSIPAVEDMHRALRGEAVPVTDHGINGPGVFITL